MAKRKLIGIGKGSQIQDGRALANTRGWDTIFTCGWYVIRTVAIRADWAKPGGVVNTEIYQDTTVMEYLLAEKLDTAVFTGHFRINDWMGDCAVFCHRSIPNAYALVPSKQVRAVARCGDFRWEANPGEYGTTYRTFQKGGMESRYNYASHVAAFDEEGHVAIIQVMNIGWNDKGWQAEIAEHNKTVIYARTPSLAHPADTHIVKDFTLEVSPA